MRARYCSLRPTVWNRVLAVFRAGFDAQWRQGAWPVAPLVMHGSIAAALALLVRDELPPYAYALFMLSIALGLIALPLLGEFGFLLRADPAREWIEAQPVRALELRVARTMLVLLLVVALSSAALLPIVLFAPSGVGIGARLVLLAAGIGQALFVTAALLGLQSLLGRRGETLLVLLQTLLVGGVVVGSIMGLRLIPQLIGVTGPHQVAAWTWLLPSSWFATALADTVQVSPAWRAAPWIAVALGLLVLFCAPQASGPSGRHSGWMSVALQPLRAIATRAWVRPAERGAFDLVFQALPLEREFVLRAYPMIAIPLAMLFASSHGSGGVERNGLIAILLFTPATYLPILLVYVPATDSPEARWILDGAPVSRAAIDNGALKAVVVRFLVPLYVLLFVLAWSQAGLEFALRLASVGFLVSIVVVRRLYRVCVGDVPLSTDPGAIQARLDWTGTLLGLGFALTLVAVLALLYVTTYPIALLVCAALIAFEWQSDRRALAEA